MSEEISVPELSEEKKAEFAKVLNARRGPNVKFSHVENVKGKEEERDENTEVKPPTDLMRKLAIISERKRQSAAQQEVVQEVASSPCIYTLGAVAFAVAIAVYFGHKAWKAYGYVPEELADLSQ